MDANPLPNLAAQAADDYSVKWVDDQTLELSDPWPVHSICTLGYSAFHAQLHYANKTLYSQFYLQNNSLLGALFFSQYVDTSDGAYGAFLKPHMKKQMRQILDWAGSSPERESVSYAAPVDIHELAAAVTTVRSVE